MEKLELIEVDMKSIFLKYLIPSVGGMLGVSLYVLGDTMMVGRGIGSTGLAALNISIPIINVFNGLGLLFGIGAATAISISRGRGDERQVNNIFTISIVMTILLGLALTLVRVFFLDELCMILGASKDTFQMSKDYLGVLMSFSIAFLLNYTLTVLVRNDGAPNLAMWGMLAGSIVNVVLDYIFIFIFNWGMWGAALATAFSPILGLMILSSHFLKRKNKMKCIKINWEFCLLKRIVSNGFASFVVELSAGLVIFIFNKVIIDLIGDIGVSAYSIIANLSLIATAIFTGVGQAIQPIVSVNFGAKKMDRVYQAGRLAIYTSFILGLLFYGLGMLFPDYLVGVFSKGDPELLAITVKGIKIYFMAFMLMGINITITSFLQSKEYAKISMVISLFRGFVFTVVFLLTLSKAFKMTGVWLTLPLSELIALILALLLSSSCRKLIAKSLKRSSKDINMINKI